MVFLVHKQSLADAYLPLNKLYYRPERRTGWISSLFLTYNQESISNQFCLPTFTNRETYIKQF